jgi:hypothetical protein
MMKIFNRNSLFLSSSMTPLSLCSIEGDDGTEVGAGFAEAAEKMASDDTRTPEQKEAAKTKVSEETNEADGKDQRDVIRELKREKREARAREAALETRLAAVEKTHLPDNQSNGNQDSTSGRPDANDATKYPLGVLDDGYIEDLIEWKSDQKVNQALDGRRKTEDAQAEQVRETARLTTLRAQVDEMAAKGADVYDDYEETVLEAGLRGDYPLTETTFTAALDATHGVDILYALANDKAEARKVSKLSPYQQLKYVAEKDGEFASKKTGRTKPKAGSPPENSPSGRNSSSPIRADTDNLDDFRKLYYARG